MLERRREHTSAKVLGRPSLFAGELASADLLYQANALEASLVQLTELATKVSDENKRVAVVGRLTSVACELGDLRRAERHLGQLEASMARAGDELTDGAFGEVLAARARCAFLYRHGSRLESAAHQLCTLAETVGDNDRLWSLTSWILNYQAMHRYFKLDIAGASEACRRASHALAKACAAPVFVKTHMLTTHAVIDAHDPKRVHLVPSENAEAYALALENGVVRNAHDALFNILSFGLSCDELGPLTAGARIAREILADPDVRTSTMDDAMVAILAAALTGRHQRALDLITQARAQYSDATFDWTPTMASLKARVLFRAARYAESEQAAADAQLAWTRSRLHGSATASRIRAESLEALGRRREAISAIGDAIDARTSSMSIPHQLRTYRCAYRLTRKSQYREHAEALVSAIERVSSHRATIELSPRRRQIAALVASGYTNPEIGHSLGLSRKTVANHLAAVYRRFGIRARWQLTRELIDSK